MIKINQRGAQTLCRNCRFVTVISDGTETTRIHCGQLARNIMFPVLECSEFKDANQPSRRDLEEIAWILNPSRRVIGFVQPGTAEHKKLIRGTPYDD